MVADKADQGYGSKNPDVVSLLRARGGTINDFYEFYASEDDYDSNDNVVENLIEVWYDSENGEWEKHCHVEASVDEEGGREGGKREGERE